MRAPRSIESEFEAAFYGQSETGRREFDPRRDRKTAQLCRQVQRALMLAMAGECGDPALRQLSVDAVKPLGGASNLVVQVGMPADIGASVPELIGRLNAAAPRLRALVAQSICRKRVPSLTFVAVPAAGPASKGGES